MAVRPSSAEASGRHFLRSSHLAVELVAGAAVARRDVVVEIGGGTGMLTQALVAAGARVVVVERDHALAAGLRRRFRRSASVRVVCADALSFAWPSEPFAVVANLPFVQSGAILSHLLNDPRVPLTHADVIVQWELAAKHAAVWPATSRATFWRAWFDVAIARRLARTCFAPVPSVDAAVLSFARREAPRVPVERSAEYGRFLEHAYRNGGPLRRALAPTVSPLQLKRLAPKLGFALDSRPRDLDAGQFAAIFLAERP